MGTTTARYFARARAFTLLASALSGCLLVTPLGDFEEAPSNAGGKGGAPTGGSHAQGGSRPTGGGGMTDGGDGGAGEAGGAGGGDGGGGTGGCATNRDCVDILGMTSEEEPARCRPTDRTCVPLRSPECLLVYGDPTDEDAVFLGAFADYYDMDPRYTTNAYPLQLAVNELNLPESGDRRPPGLNGAQVVVTICDNSSPAVVRAGIDHLANDIQTAGVVATLKPADLMTAFSAHDDVLFLSPTGRTNAVTALDEAHDPDHDLIWSLLGLPGDYERAYVLLLGLVEEYSKHHTIRDPMRPLRVSLIVESGDPQSAELATMLRQKLVFNDMTADEQGGTDGTFQVVTLRSTTTTAVSNAILELLGFFPDVVVSAAGSVFTRESGILRSLERDWESVSRPFYVLSPYNVTELGPTSDWLQTILDPETGNGEANATSRFLGLSLASPDDTTLANEFASRLGGAFNGPNDRTNSDTGNYYDAMYLLSYAAYAAGLDEPLTGQRLADGLARMLDPAATEFSIGPDYVRTIIGELDQGENIQFRGTLGPADFVGSHQQVAGALFCWEVDIEGTPFLRQDVLTYIQGSDELRLNELYNGVFPCFDNFFP